MAKKQNKRQQAAAPVAKPMQARGNLQQKAQRIAQNAGRARQAQFAARHPKAAAKAGVRPRQTIQMTPTKPQSQAPQLPTTPSNQGGWQGMPGVFGGAPGGGFGGGIDKPTAGDFNNGQMGGKVEAAYNDLAPVPMDPAAARQQASSAVNALGRPGAGEMAGHLSGMRPQVMSGGWQNQPRPTWQGQYPGQGNQFNAPQMREDIYSAMDSLGQYSGNSGESIPWGYNTAIYRGR